MCASPWLKIGTARHLSWLWVFSASFLFYLSLTKDKIKFSKDGSFIYFTAGDLARTKVFTLPVAPTPSQSTTHPNLDPKFTNPTLVYSSNAASGLQILPSDRILFTQSSLTSPNDVWILKDLKPLEKAILAGDQVESIQTQVERITHFCESDLTNKKLSRGEEFWFKGADDKDVQGWVVKPKGWKPGEKKKWPVILFIHGGRLLLIRLVEDVHRL